MEKILKKKPEPLCVCERQAFYERSLFAFTSPHHPQHFPSLFSSLCDSVLFFYALGAKRKSFCARESFLPPPPPPFKQQQQQQQNSTKKCLRPAVFFSRHPRVLSIATLNRTHPLRENDRERFFVN